MFALNYFCDSIYMYVNSLCSLHKRYFIVKSVSLQTMSQVKIMPLKIVFISDDSILLLIDP